MALDASILQGVRPIEFPSKFEGYKNALTLESGMNQNAMAQYSLAKARREDAETEAFNRALRGADLTTPEGRMAAQKNALAASPQKGIAFGNQLLEQDSKRATLDKTRADTAKQLADQAARMIAGAKTDQEMDQAFQFWAQGNPQQAQVVRSQYMQARQSGAQVPDLAPKIASLFSEDVLKQIQAFAQKVEFQDIGGSKVPVNTNTLAGPVGPIAGVNALTKTLSPEGQETARHNPIMEGIARGNLGVAQSNLGLSRERLDFERGQGKAPAGYRYKPDGVTLEAIPGGPADGLTTTQKDDLTSIARTRASATRLKDMFRPEFVGFKGSMGEFWDKYGSQTGLGPDGNTERIQFRALASDLENQYIKAISGATVPTSEVPRLRRAIPTPSDSPAQYKAKLEEMEINLGTLPEVIRNGAKPGAPPAPPSGPKGKSPAVGAIQKGYRFKGGDPASQSSWEKV